MEKCGFSPLVVQLGLSKSVASDSSFAATKFRLHVAVEEIVGTKMNWQGGHDVKSNLQGQIK